MVSKSAKGVGALYPASIVGGQASLAPTPQGNPGVKLSQRLSIMKALHHTFFTNFFHMPCNGSAISCTLIHQAPSPERSSTDYEPLRPPQPRMHKSHLLSRDQSLYLDLLYVAEGRILHTASCIAQSGDRPIVRPSCKLLLHGL
jgi:hypothetical protein